MGINRRGFLEGIAALGMVPLIHWERTKAKQVTAPIRQKSPTPTGPYLQINGIDLSEHVKSMSLDCTTMRLRSSRMRNIGDLSQDSNPKLQVQFDQPQWLELSVQEEYSIVMRSNKGKPSKTNPEYSGMFILMNETISTDGCTVEFNSNG